MAFFEELGRKISQSSQGAVQKTKDMAEIVKYNSMISDEEKKVAALTIQIGKTYLERRGDSPDPEYAAFVAEIKEANARVAVYHEQVRRLRGVTTCQSCGAEVAYTAPFCSACGTKMAAAQAQAAAVPGAQAQAAAAMGAQAGGAEAAAGTWAGAPAPFAAQGGGVCPKCGAAMQEGMLFCTNCGYKAGEQR